MEATPKKARLPNVCRGRFHLFTSYSRVFPFAIVNTTLSESYRVARYYSLLAKGNKNGAYGLAAQLFDGMDLSDISKLCEESFQENMQKLVSPQCFSLFLREPETVHF